jgi:hypothetical protein
MNKFTKIITFMVLLSTLGISACVAKSGQTGSVQAILPVVSNGEGGGEGEGAEVALVTFSDIAQGFSIAYPQPWSRDDAITTGVKFNGGDDSMLLEFVTLSAATDAMAYAKNDETVIKNQFTNYKMVGLDASTEVKNAIVLGFEASGKSTVTGKDYTARGDRYYMPTNDGRLAILTVVGPVQNYDREGVRDIALTFKLSK